MATTGTIYAGDVGRAIQISINTSGIVDGTTITSAIVGITKPSGVSAEFAFSLSSALTSSVVLTRVSDGTECDEAGKTYARVWLLDSGVEVASSREFLLFNVLAARVTRP
jgi:hypothetical protein